jgi:uncharacterized protein YwqG
MLNPDELAKLFQENDLSELVDSIVATATPCISVQSKMNVMDNLSVGSSKLGGLPDLPADFRWPTKGNRPLAFLAQMSLSDIHSADSDCPLPAQGLLTFWYDTAEMPWGFDPKDKHAFQVHYFPLQPNQLIKREFPEFESDGLKSTPNYPFTPFEECEAFMKRSTSYDFEISNQIEKIAQSTSDGNADAVSERFFDLLDEELQGDPDDANHQLLGLPVQIQGDMATECQLVSNGIYLGDAPPKSEEKKIEALRPGIKDWRLLFQIQTDEDGPGWMWGDMGTLFFWIKDNDLRKGDFSNCWGVLQCY